MCISVQIFAMKLLNQQIEKKVCISNIYIKVNIRDCETVEGDDSNQDRVQMRGLK